MPRKPLRSDVFPFKVTEASLARRKAARSLSTREFNEAEGRRKDAGPQKKTSPFKKRRTALDEATNAARGR